jgi:hypothetical protein
MSTWKTMEDAPKDRAVLLWVNRFGTLRACRTGIVEPHAAVVDAQLTR